MRIRTSICLVIVLLAFLTTIAGMSLRGVGIDLRCRCIETENRRGIMKLIHSVEIFPPSSHCKHTEIIATQKNSQLEICLDGNALWVQNLIEKMLPKKNEKSEKMR